MTLMQSSKTKRDFGHMRVNESELDKESTGRYGFVWEGGGECVWLARLLCLFVFVWFGLSCFTDS